MATAIDDTKTRVLRAAGPVFATQGYQGATVRDICNAANVNVASVNYYFGDKERLYLETVHQAHRWIAEQVPLPAWPDGTPPAQKLQDFILTTLRRMIGNESSPWQTRLMLREVLHPTSACQELARDYFQPHLDLLLSILDELLPGETSLAQRRQIAFSIVGQCMFYRVAGDVVSLLVPADDLKRDFSVASLAQHIAQLSLGGMASLTS